jgi:hypothetical protein
MAEQDYIYNDSFGEKIFNSKIEEETKIEPKDWMPEKYRQT